MQICSWFQLADRNQHLAVQFAVEAAQRVLRFQQPDQGTADRFQRSGATGVAVQIIVATVRENITREVAHDNGLEFEVAGRGLVTAVACAEPGTHLGGIALFQRRDEWRFILQPEGKLLLMIVELLDRLGSFVLEHGFQRIDLHLDSLRAVDLGAINRKSISKRAQP